MDKDLEKVLKDKLKPIIDKSMLKAIGVTIKELESDITSKLASNPFMDYHIDPSVKFKIAKKLFRIAYIEKLLSSYFGDVSAVARICSTDRRTIHRIIKEGHIDIGKRRKDMYKPEYVKSLAISSIIETVLGGYKEIIHPKKLDNMYKSVTEMSEDIVKELPLEHITLKEAENEFEKRYFKKALEVSHGNISLAAKNVGLRFESLHRKLKFLKLI
ncbi:hypothetical protein J4468_01285 [Candidatus Woesearchaeota archaeon]|nr:hypothetical protein [Candidatus Woesearchaeota archaeon]